MRCLHRLLVNFVMAVLHVCLVESQNVGVVMFCLQSVQRGLLSCIVYRCVLTTFLKEAVQKGPFFVCWVRKTDSEYLQDSNRDCSLSM